VTENRYGSVVFEGVCSDLSNAAYPVEEVRRAVEPSFEPPWVDAAVHLGLTLLHHGYVVHEKGGNFALSDEAHGALEESRLVAEVCETIEPRVRKDDDADPEMAAFVGFVRRVVGALTDEEEKV